jgi:CHAD domain-containing protein
MPDNQHSFIIPEDQSVPALVSLLQEAFPVQVQAESVYHRVFYDTFDWRLFKHGSALEVHDDGKSHRIYWRADKDGKLKIQLGLNKIPHLAAELPAGDFRQQLQSIITVRELLSRVKVRINRRSFAVLDKHKKIVVRLYFDTYWYKPSKLRAAKVLTKRLTIKAVKGYTEDYKQVEALLLAMPVSEPLADEQLDPLLYPQPSLLQSAQDNVMKLALIAMGVSTNEYTTRLNMRVEHDMPAQQVLKEVMLCLLDIMQHNTAGCIRGRDTEYMHDYRVAIRKIRVALKQLKHMDAQAAYTEYKTLFSRLGELSNPVRDLDVFLLQLENLRPQFEESGWQQLQAFREYLSHSRAEAQKILTDELKSSRYHDDIKKFRDYLRDDGEGSGTSDKPGIAIYKLADEKLWQITQLALKQGNTITDNSDAEAVHELRKIFKQLRYLIDFFQGLYPAVQLRELIQTLIDVQDELGEFNDRSIQIGMVKAFIEQSKDEGAIKAAEQLIEILHQQQHEAGQNFKHSYASFSSSGSQKKFKEIFVEYYGGKK